MRNIRVLALLLIPVALLVIVGAGTVLADSNHLRPAFGAWLRGSQEVPPVETEARGLSGFILNRAGTEIRYSIFATEIMSVTAGHIHSGTVGINGPVVANLYSPDACRVQGDRVLCRGVITADDLVGPLAGRPLSELVMMMRERRTYTNVHTTANPSGEIRGQNHRLHGNGNEEGNKDDGANDYGDDTE